MDRIGAREEVKKGFMNNKLIYKRQNRRNSRRYLVFEYFYSENRQGNRRYRDLVICRICSVSYL